MRITCGDTENGTSSNKNVAAFSQRAINFDVSKGAYSGIRLSGEIVELSNDAANGVQISMEPGVIPDIYRGIASRGYLTKALNVNQYAYFSADPTTIDSVNAGSTIGEVFGYLASNRLDADGLKAGNSYGFYSGLNVGSGNNYNFYAAGTANYFLGETVIKGGTTLSFLSVYQNR